jgi:hypothetical protein
VDPGYILTVEVIRFVTNIRGRVIEDDSNISDLSLAGCSYHLLRWIGVGVERDCRKVV